MEDSARARARRAATGATVTVAWLIGVSIVATGFAKLPLSWSGIDPARYWLHTGELLATLPLMVYLSRCNGLPHGWSRVDRDGDAGDVVAFLLPRESDLSVLARLHLFIALWALVAVPFIGRAFGQPHPASRSSLSPARWCC